MKRLNFLPLLLALSFVICGLSTQSINGSSIHNPTFIWKHQPPLDATNMTVDYLCLQRLKDGSQSLMTGSTDIKIKNDTVYFPFYHSLYELNYAPYDYNFEYGEVANWIAGIVKSDEIIFKNMALHSILIDSVQSYVFDPNDFTEYVDTTGIYYRAIKEIDAPYSYSSHLTDVTAGTKVRFKCSQDDIIGKCDVNKGLFHNFNYSLCVAPKYANEIGYEYFNGATEYWLAPGCVIDEFLTGKISATPPTSLPAPELSYSIEHVSGHSMGGFFWEDYTAKLDFKMPIVNQDHTLMDPLNLYIKLFENGELIDNFSFYNFGNPFNFAHRYRYKLAKWNEDPITGELLDENPLTNNRYEALIYYKDSEGSIVESPKALLKYPSDADSITEMAAPEPVYDGKTYDLTGREVNPDALAPGIYIRNGRKFAVGR